MFLFYFFHLITNSQITKETLKKMQGLEPKDKACVSQPIGISECGSGQVLNRKNQKNETGGLNCKELGEKSKPGPIKKIKTKAVESKNDHKSDSKTSDEELNYDSDTSTASLGSLNSYEGNKLTDTDASSGDEKYSRRK